jgi:hypothetical protein
MSLLSTLLIRPLDMKIVDRMRRALVAPYLFVQRQFIHKTFCSVCRWKIDHHALILIARWVTGRPLGICLAPSHCTASPIGRQLLTAQEELGSIPDRCLRTITQPIQAGVRWCWTIVDGRIAALSVAHPGLRYGGAALAGGQRWV